VARTHANERLARRVRCCLDGVDVRERPYVHLDINITSWNLLITPPRYPIHWDTVCKHPKQEQIGVGEPLQEWRKRASGHDGCSTRPGHEQSHYFDQEVQFPTSSCSLIVISITMSANLANPKHRNSSTTSSHISITATDSSPLTTLIHRLEAATSRLEDIASSAHTFDANQQSFASLPVPSLKSNIQASSSAPDLTQTGSKNGGSTPKPPSAPSAPSVPPTVAAMDELINKEVSFFIDSSQNIDPLISEQSSAVAKAFADQRRFLLTTTRAKKPDMQSPQTFNDLLKDLQHDMGVVGDIRDSNRASKMKEHLAMVGEGIGALQWLLMEGKPADFVAEILGGSQMYGNRVLKAWKET